MEHSWFECKVFLFLDWFPYQKQWTQSVWLFAIAGRRKNRFMPLPRALSWSNLQLYDINYSYRIRKDFKHMYLNDRQDPNRYHQSTKNLEVNVLMGLSSFRRSPEVKPPHQMQFSIIPFVGGGFLPSAGDTVCSLNTRRQRDHYLNSIISS